MEADEDIAPIFWKMTSTLRPWRLPVWRHAASTLASAIAALEAGRRQAMVLPEGAPTMI